MEYASYYAWAAVECETLRRKWFDGTIQEIHSSHMVLSLQPWYCHYQGYLQDFPSQSTLSVITWGVWLEAYIMKPMDTCTHHHSWHHQSQCSYVNFISNHGNTDCIWGLCINWPYCSQNQVTVHSMHSLITNTITKWLFTIFMDCSNG